ncbi:MAG TPA: ATP-binding cassette domain-containing protein [Alphaproteobacteria bacterium]|nr:ATP-binding cassette domain-containing protein [Alphaproteobacteria bacterium]
MTGRDPIAPEGKRPLLELVGISKSFRRSGGSIVKAVSDVSLTIGYGETVALVGESGSGKSTLGRIALCLITPDRGTVHLAGECLTSLTRRQLRVARTRMQPIFQDPAASFNPRRTVAELLGQALRRLDGADRERQAIDVLERVGLKPGRAYLPRFPHELSGGQRQRLAIARAIAMDPILIIADEPLSGADVSIRGQILNLLDDLQAERGVAYLMITHDISVARSFASRVAVMMQGEIVETGPAEAVLTAPIHPYTRRLIAAVPAVPSFAAGA